MSWQVSEIIAEELIDQGKTSGSPEVGEMQKRLHCSKHSHEHDCDALFS
jgi:hypothetical protein